MKKIIYAKKSNTISPDNEIFALLESSRKNIDIVQEVKNYMSSHNETAPVIIFDDLSIPEYKLDQIERLCGERAGLNESYRHFFETLKGLGVRMYFVITGDKGGKQKYLKTKTDLIGYKTVRGLIHQKKPVEVIAESIDDLGRPARQTFHEFKKKYGRMLVATGDYTTVFIQLAALAIKHKALAVVTDKIRLLAFGGQFKIWIGGSLDCATLQVQSYDTKKLNDQYGITYDQYPLAVCLLTMKNLRSDDPELEKNADMKLWKFNKENKSCSPQKFIELANNIDETLDKIFGTEDDRYHAMFRSTLSSIKNPRGPQIEEPIFELAKSLDINIYRAVVNQPIPLQCPYFDEHRYENVKYSDMVDTLIQKMDGVLFANRRHATSGRVIYNLNTKKILPPIYPDFEVPDLLQLLDQREFPDLNDCRYKILGWIFGTTNQWKDIPRSYFVSLLLLEYLTKRKYINMYEAKLILITLYHDVEGRILASEKLPCPQTIQPRGFYLAQLFNKMHNEFWVIVLCIGLVDKAKTNNFDGVFFHTLNNRLSVPNNHAQQEMEWRKYPQLKRYELFLKPSSSLNTLKNNYAKSWRGSKTTESN